MFWIVESGARYFTLNLRLTHKQENTPGPGLIRNIEHFYFTINRKVTVGDEMVMEVQFTFSPRAEHSILTELKSLG